MALNRVFDVILYAVVTICELHRLVYGLIEGGRAFGPLT